MSLDVTLFFSERSGSLERAKPVYYNRERRLPTTCHNSTPFHSAFVNTQATFHFVNELNPSL